MLSWSTLEFQAQLKDNNQLPYALEAIKWGTDYLIIAHPEPHFLYGQVGDGDSDHAFWQRPEDMTTPRPNYKIDEKNPGADLAAETAAAFAASSLAFKPTKDRYIRIHTINPCKTGLPRVLHLMPLTHFSLTTFIYIFTFLTFFYFLLIYLI